MFTSENSLKALLWMSNAFIGKKHCGLQHIVIDFIICTSLKDVMYSFSSFLLPISCILRISFFIFLVSASQTSNYYLYHMRTPGLVKEEPHDQSILSAFEEVKMINIFLSPKITCFYPTKLWSPVLHA